jgi:hypothetical protein
MNNDITCYTCMTLLKEDDAERFAGVWTCDECHERLVTEDRLWLEQYWRENAQDLDKANALG